PPHLSPASLHDALAISPASFRIQLAHDIIDQQDRGRAVKRSYVLGLGQFESDSQSPLLTFAGEVCRVAIIEQKIQFIPMRPNDGDRKSTRLNSSHPTSS